MNKLKSFWSSDLTKIIQEFYPIVKNRTPYWFFTQELNKTRENRLKRNEVSDLWNKMDPESKRIYFNMAELDVVRFKEEKSRWMVEVGSLFSKQADLANKTAEHLPSKKDIDATSIDEYKRIYEHMIQAKSTNKMYKDIIDKKENLDVNMSTKKLISSVPLDVRPVLSRPRRPTCPFAIFTWHKRDEIVKLRSEEKYSKLPYLKIASLEWNKMSEDEKSYYNQRYNELLQDYKTSMEVYKKMNINEDEEYLERASREKRAFRKSLRKRLRDNGVLPVSVRNAFNFYVQDNRNVKLLDLTVIWRNLPEEEKLKYKKMNRDDALRYYKERLEYRQFMSSLTDLIEKKKPPSTTALRTKS